MKWWIVMPALLTVVGPSAVRGQPSPLASPPVANTKLARRHYDLGEQLYRTSSYAEALTQFKQAYELAPRPALLFNIARCHEVLAQLEPAIEAYELFLNQAPTADSSDLVRSRLANLRRRLELRKKEDEQRRAVEEQRTARERRRAEPVSAPVAPHESSSRWKRTAGWITLGVGVALLATGIAFGALAKKKADEFTPGTKLYEELDDIDRQGKTFNTIAIATLVAGGIAAATGAGLLVWDWRGAGRTDRAALVPFATPDGGGLAGFVQF